MRSPPRSRWLSRALCLAGLLLGGCVVSPQPEPPAIVASLLSLESHGEIVTLRGAPGAVTPGGATLEMLDLDTTAAGTNLTVADDGSFSLPLSGAPADEYRLQAISGPLRSDPLDVTGVEGLIVGSEELALVKRALADCFVLAPALEVDFLHASTVGITTLSNVTVTLTNSCAGDVTVGGFSLRAGSPAFTTSPATGPLVVPAGGQSSFVATFDRQAAGPLEDVLFVRIDAPAKDRRPLTLRGFTP